MFEILYRIVEEWKTLDEFNFEKDDITGLFEINVNGYKHGYYHNRLLMEGELLYETELLSRWFIDLVKACHALCNSDYAAISDIESYICWIEFIRIQDMVQISVIRAEKEDGSTSLRLAPFETFEYGEWYHQLVKLSDFRAELLKKASSYLNELYKINPILLKNRDNAELKALVSSL